MLKGIEGKEDDREGEGKESPEWEGGGTLTHSFSNSGDGARRPACGKPHKSV